MEIGHADARVEPTDLRVVPPNRKENRRVQQVAEVVSVVGILPEVITVDDQVSPERLLKSRMEFVALPGANRPRLPAKDSIQERITRDAGNHQVFVEGSLKDARVGNAHNRIARLDVVGNPGTRLDL